MIHQLKNVLLLDKRDVPVTPPSLTHVRMSAGRVVRRIDYAKSTSFKRRTHCTALAMYYTEIGTKTRGSASGMLL